MARPNTERPKKKKGDSEVTEPKIEFKDITPKGKKISDPVYYQDVPVVPVMTDPDNEFVLSRIDEKDATVEPELTIKYDTRPSSALKYGPKNMVEFAPPEPETNICPLCGCTIPDDTLRSPNILCVKCHRPIACPSCKKEILEPVGITECPWCHSEPESTKKIKHALRVREEKKTYEEEQAERYKSMTDYATASTTQPMGMDLGRAVMTTEGYIPPPDPIGPKPWDPPGDQYPYRDGPDLMVKKGGWGAPFDVSTEKQAIHSVARRQTEMGLYELAEEAQRGTGRSTQRQLSALNHLYHRESNKIHMHRRVLFIVDTQRHVKETIRSLENLYVKRFNLGSGVFETLFTKRDKIIDVVALNGLPMHGRHYTLAIFDLVSPIPKSQAKNLRLDVSRYGCPIIGGESITEMEDPEMHGPFDPRNPKVIIDGDEIPVTDMKVTMNRDVQPVYAMGERRAIVHNRGPATVEGTFKGVMGSKPKTLKEIAEDQKKIATVMKNDHREIIGYAMDKPTDDGFIAIHSVDHQGGQFKARLVKEDKTFEPGNLVHADDIVSMDDPIMKLPKPAAMDILMKRSRKEKPPRSARRKWAEPSQSLTTTLNESLTLKVLVGGLRETFGWAWKWALFCFFLFILFLLGSM